MAHFVSNPTQQNYYFKNNLCYTEDHVPVQKLYLHSIPPELREDVLLPHFNNYGKVVRMKIFGNDRYRRMPQRGLRGQARQQHEPQRCGKWQMKTGYVFFANPRDAAKALHSRVHHVNGRRLHVKASDSWHQPAAYGSDDKHPPGDAHILKITDHCLSMVVEYLPLSDQLHFSRTCTRFRGVYLLVTRTIHRSMDFCKFDGLTVWDIKDFFTLSGRYVKEFKGVIPEAHCERMCDFFGANCVNVKSLEITESKLNTRNMNKLFFNNEKIEDLVLSSCGLSDGSLMSLRKLNKLKSLTIAYNPKLNGTELDKLPVSIETIVLTGCTGLLANRLIQMCRILVNLKDLNVIGVMSAYSNFYETLVKKNCCPSLETLRLSIDDETNYEEIPKLPKLKHVQIATLPRLNIRSRFFDHLVSMKSQQLEQFELYGAKNLPQHLLLQLGKLSSLKNLILVRVDDVRDDVLEEFTQLTNLEHITLRLCHNITDTGVMRLILACHKLQELNLEDCSQITEKLVHTVIKRVQHQIKFRQNEHQLPIDLYVQGTKIQESLETDPIVAGAKNIIRLHFTSQYGPYLLHLSMSNLLLDDFDYDPHELEQDTDDEMDIFDDHYMFDMGFLSENDLEDSDPDSDDLNVLYPYVHASYPYDANGDFMGFGIFDSDSD
ncbi:uncharacterized protein Dwil_GK19510 [Drosophila willistoni]|uniref:RRM domain-containing protein n=1 Tax=Drosophila willistoni TaxID=7260 RepID=B4MNU0_DROWI|nr:uncharacterized protein LOC6639861 [Drosophila willistoni]EDW73779.1 uncharacterized protein Dwil_GK19510 [Drosophila willistoni]